MNFKLQNPTKSNETFVRASRKLNTDWRPIVTICDRVNTLQKFGSEGWRKYITIHILLAVEDKN